MMNKIHDSGEVFQPNSGGCRIQQKKGYSVLLATSPKKIAFSQKDSLMWWYCWDFCPTGAVPDQYSKFKIH